MAGGVAWRLDAAHSLNTKERRNGDTPGPPPDAAAAPATAVGVRGGGWNTKGEAGRRAGGRRPAAPGERCSPARCAGEWLGPCEGVPNGE